MEQADARTVGAGRVEFVDVLRGFALAGVFAANLFIFSGFEYMDEGEQAQLLGGAFGRAVYLLHLILIENKFMGLFALLFGVSFWLFLERARARGLGGTGLFYRRLGWLFLIGCIHGWLLWCFDILRFYALWGLFLPLFARLPKRVLLGSALGCAVLAPALVSGIRFLIPAAPDGGADLDALALQAFSSGSLREMLRVNWLYDWYLTNSIGQIGYQVAVLGRLLLGLLIARAGLLTDHDRRRPLLFRVLAWGALVGLFANVAVALHWLSPLAKSSFAGAFAARFIKESGFLALSLAYAAGLALLFQNRRSAGALRMLGPVGRMALTLYLFQTLLGLWLFYGFLPGPHLMGKLGPAWFPAIWLVGFAAQIAFASLWLRRFRFGPAEWVWRSLTYGKLQPFR